MILSLEDLNFDIESIKIGTGYLNGDEDNELLIAQPSNRRNRLEGREGDDILIGSNGEDWFNGGAGNAAIIAGNGTDTVFVDHSSVGESVNIDFTDTDSKRDRLVFGNDLRSYGEVTLGTTFVTVKGWSEEDVLVMRDLIGVNDNYFSVPTPDDMLVYVSHDDNLSVIRLEGAGNMDINIVERTTI